MSNGDVCPRSVLYPERSGLAAIDECEITHRYAIPGRRYADFAILRVSSHLSASAEAISDDALLK